MSMELHNQLVNKYFQPFHDQVKRIYADYRKQGASQVYHLDAHSMPSKGNNTHKDPGQIRADIVVSDQEGKSCSTEFKDLVIKAYENTGLKVGYNWPYLGGRVTQTYGKPELGQHTIQVEIKRSLYMDEENKQWVAKKAQALCDKLDRAVKHIVRKLPDLK